MALSFLICLAVLHVGGVNEAKAAGGAFPPPPPLSAPPVPPQFDITGFIQEASLDTEGAVCRPSDPRLAGGTLKVNDVTVVVPCNTVLQMPAATLTWQELFSLAPRDIGLPLGTDGIPTQTGLALQDTVTMPLTMPYSSGRLPSYEVHVQGNVVNGKYIAGLIFISQQNLNIGQGRITTIDYNNSELSITSAGPLGSIARVKINDPLGRFGLSHGAPGSAAALIEPGYDQRFSVDAESPTIHAATGYPMCIPRSDPFNDADDPLCPQANRPRSPDCASLPAPFPAFVLPAAGQFCTSFMMPPPPINPCTPAAGRTCPPDPTQQAPFEVGDFIDFLGTLKFDSKGPYISAHTITARVGTYTTPGIMPAYASIEMELQGTAAFPLANLPQEATSRVKVEGFTTDPSNLVDIYALDVHPVTGAISERLLGIANPSGPPVVGRFRFIPNAGAFLPPTRELRVVSRTMCANPSLPCVIPATPRTYANGLTAGQYHAPNFEFIFTENLILGDPGLPANFQDMAFLYCGSGPLTTPTAGVTPPLVGQLDPAPWAVPMQDPLFASTLCPTARKVNGTGGATVLLAPVANAVATPASVGSGQSVNMSAIASSDPNTPPRPLTFRWTQTNGPAVLLSGATSATPSFVAPAVSAATTLTFNVAVTNTVPLTANASVSITVNPLSAPASVDISAPVSVAAGSTVTMVGAASAGSTVKWAQTAGLRVALSGANTLTTSFIAPKGPSSVTFTLTATTAAGAVTTAMRSIAVTPDGVAILPVDWVHANGTLSIAATSTAITSATIAPPAGMTMTATFWNRNLPVSVLGGAANPISAPMALVTNVSGQAPICPSALPCFSAAIPAVIADPSSPSGTTSLLPPTTVVVRSSLGGSATAAGTAIRVR